MDESKVDMDGHPPIVRSSGFKHGLTADQIRAAAQTPALGRPYETESGVLIEVHFLPSDGRPIELGYAESDELGSVLIHANFLTKAVRRRAQLP
ncbi:UNVERIFIED_CONTAM: hypothetical protein LK11_39070 [Mumia flava]|uniref:hypothetical protein n=1 Tax=Mumia flava TaxID=1348852 RepID=UPI000574318A|nr:hypothetical protein [Mumia flava]